MYSRNIYIALLMLLFFSSCEIPTSSMEASKNVDVVIYIPGREPEFEEVLDIVEANEESFLHLFPSFDRENNRLKLCYVNKLGVDYYYLKDKEGQYYAIGKAYNWNFWHDYPSEIQDSTEITTKPDSFDRCSLLEI